VGRRLSPWNPRSTYEPAVARKQRGVSVTPRSKPTLAAAGIDKELAKRARKKRKPVDQGKSVPTTARRGAPKRRLGGSISYWRAPGPSSPSRAPRGYPRSRSLRPQFHGDPPLSQISSASSAAAARLNPHPPPSQRPSRSRPGPGSPRVSDQAWLPTLLPSRHRALRVQAGLGAPGRDCWCREHKISVGV
jgi:hypothetical protein